MPVVLWCEADDCYLGCGDCAACVAYREEDDDQADDGED